MSHSLIYRNGTVGAGYDQAARQFVIWFDKDVTDENGVTYDDLRAVFNVIRSSSDRGSIGLYGRVKSTGQWVALVKSAGI